MPARQGRGVNGDLLVVIDEERNPELVRDGNDLIHNLNITVPTALLGGSVEIPTVDGRVKIKIDPGTHAGKDAAAARQGTARRERLRHGRFAGGGRHHRAGETLGPRRNGWSSSSPSNRRSPSRSR